MRCLSVSMKNTSTSFFGSFPYAFSVHKIRLLNPSKILNENEQIDIIHDPFIVQIELTEDGVAILLGSLSFFMLAFYC